MKLMMLGASSAQLAGIRTAQAMGHQVVVCDYLPEAPGHRLADHSVLASTFDYEAVLTAARAFRIDGIMTMGTDQPVYTAARVAKALELPSLLSPETALAVTHKGVMKRRLAQGGVPLADYRIYRKGEDEGLLRDLVFPVVVKPLDSQGQRGVRYLESPEAVAANYEEVLAFSREKGILVESHYPHEEVTVSGWVWQGQARVLAVTDRISFSDKDRIGICLSHEYPSRHREAHGAELLGLTQRIVDVMGIGEGPLYFQFFIGAEGILVNEIACRIGGAYEAEYLPAVTGVDICRLQILAALGLPAEDPKLQAADLVDGLEHWSVQLFFAEPGIAAGVTPLEEILACEGVFKGGLSIAPGSVLKPIRDATARAGFVIVRGPDRAGLEKRLQALYRQLRIEDDSGRDLLIHRPLSNFGG